MKRMPGLDISRITRRAGIVKVDDVDSGIIEQSPLWMRSVTLAIAGSAVLGIGWLGFARTEEVVVVQGRLEPQGWVKDIQPILPGVVKDVLVKEGSRVSKGQLLIRLDKQVAEKSMNTTIRTLQAKEEQLQLKKAEIKKTQDMALSRDKSLRATLALQEEVLMRLESLNRSGGIPELQYLSQRDKVQMSRSDISQNLLDLQRQIEILRQQERS